MSKKVKTRLSEDEAREYSASLGKAATGNWELMDFAIHTLRVPESLDMDAGQWVESIGGYVRMSIEQRRDAVQALLADGKGNAEISRILGIGEWTVMRDKQVIEAAIASQQAAIEPGTPAIATAKNLTAAERKAKIRELIDMGKTDAEIAVALGGMDPSGIKKHRKEYKYEQSVDILAEKKAAKDALVSEADKKAGDAAAENIGDQMKKGVTSALGISPVEGLEDAVRDMRTILDADVEIDFDRALLLWVALGDDLWVYGAKRGLDVSEVATKIERMKGGDGG